jgi:hypothetical protein
MKAKKHKGQKDKFSGKVIKGMPESYSKGKGSQKLEKVKHKRGK